MLFFIQIKPSRFNLLLHDETASAQQATNSYLVRPKDATLLYENKHFGNQPLEIYELVPPRSGFSCLGKCFKCSVQSTECDMMLLNGNLHDLATLYSTSCSSTKVYMILLYCSLHEEAE